MSEPPIRPSRSRLWREHTMHTRSGKITTRRAHYKNLTNIQPLVPGNISPDEFKGKLEPGKEISYLCLLLICLN